MIGNRCRAIHRRYDGEPDACPNDRCDFGCVSATKFYEEKILFDSELAGECLILSPHCNGTTIRKYVDVNSNIVSVPSPTETDRPAYPIPLNSTIVTAPIPSQIDRPAYLTMYGAHRAEKSCVLLPNWLQTYFE